MSNTIVEADHLEPPSWRVNVGCATGESGTILSQGTAVCYTTPKARLRPVNRGALDVCACLCGLRPVLSLPRATEMHWCLHRGRVQPLGSRGAGGIAKMNIVRYVSSVTTAIINRQIGRWDWKAGWARKSNCHVWRDLQG